jgi:integrase
VAGPLSVRITPDQWDGDKVVRHNNREKINAYLRDRRNVAVSTLFDLETTGRIGDMSVSAVKKQIEDAFGGYVAESYSFIDHFNRMIESKAKRSTQTIYRQTLVKIVAHDRRNLAFTDITYTWLKGFENYLTGAGISVNSINIHMRNIRAVMNDAIAENKAPLSCYPFRKYKLKKEQTRHRALSAAQLGRFCAFECTEAQKQYRDIFMLIFYLGGINIVDLCNLKEIRGGYVEYRRAKTGRLYRIKVEPEALEIIERYRGRNYLLNIVTYIATSRSTNVKSTAPSAR